MSLSSRLKSANIIANPRHLFYKPSWLVLGVNNICNLHCKMCDVGTQTLYTNFAKNLVGTEPLNMPIELFKRVVDQARDFCPDVKLGYAFTEPLLYPHLIESLAYAKQNGLHTAVTTNALNLKKMAPELAAVGLKELFVSLDGPQDIHNAIRGHKSSFQRAIEGIDEIIRLDAGIQISIYCVITEWNIGYLREFAKYFSKYPLTRLGFMHTNFTDQSIVDAHNSVWMDHYPATVSNIEQTDISKMNMELLWEEIAEIKSMPSAYPIVFSPEVSSYNQLLDFYLHPEKKIGKRCNDVFHNIMIKSDGTVIPAHGRCYNLTLGNLNSESLEEVWNSKVYGQFRSDILKAGGLFPACSRCCSAF